MRNIAANVISILIVVGIVLLIGIGYAKREFVAPGPLEAETIVLLPRGAGLNDTSRLLMLHGAIDSEFLFRLGARYRRDEREIRYGEYRIPPGASMEEILDMLVRGESIQHKVTVAPHAVQRPEQSHEPPARALSRTAGQQEQGVGLGAGRDGGHHRHGQPDVAAVRLVGIFGDAEPPAAGGHRRQSLRVFQPAGLQDQATVAPGTGHGGAEKYGREQPGGKWQTIHGAA